MAERNYREIRHEFWKPENEDDTLEGKVLGTIPTNYDGKAGEAIKVELDDGTVKFVNYTAVNETLKDCIGKFVKLVYKGEKEVSKGRRPYKDIKVFVSD